MVSFFKRIYKADSNKKTNIKVENISDSAIDIKAYYDSKIVNRADFEPDEQWFEKLLSISYDMEIKSKYIPELHQSNEFERNQLSDILYFEQFKGNYTNQIRICKDYIKRFKESYRDFHQIIVSEEITITNIEHPFLKQIKKLHSDLDLIEENLLKVSSFFESEEKAISSSWLKSLIEEIINRLKFFKKAKYNNNVELSGYSAKGYEILNLKNQIKNISHSITNTINFNNNDWSEFLDKELKEKYILRYLVQHYNQVYYELSSLNRMLEYFRTQNSNKIIAGNAGTGKTHISAYLINHFRENGEYVIFFKSKQFNGDNVNLNDRLLQLLQIPKGYTLNEALEILNKFAKSKNKRCFIIIDALNETTKSSIGFSNIWENYLQEFINHIELYSNLYLISTLRTSYINHIWQSRPSSIVEIKGFEKSHDIKEACIKYFDYYKIVPLNLHTADISIFSIPLLLDLYCKLVNESRTVKKEVILNMNTYLQIFEDYIFNLTAEVKLKLNLQKDKPIKNGFNESSEKFFLNNEAIISIDEFSDSFDKDDTLTTDKSIARAVLEGYLVFIKDFISHNNEIIKHTQQEVGGYLLAKYLSEKILSKEDLLNNQDFKDKIIGIDATKHHQLRLDILKFLIALRPELIPHLQDKDSLRLSWWFLYNGFDIKHGDIIPDYLLSEYKDSSIRELLAVSSNHWFNPDHKFNFHFVAKLLEKLDTWTFDLNWTFLIYDEVDFFYEFIEDSTRVIKENKENEYSLEYHKVVAKFIAYTTATTIRELRDLATIYLIEFGKKYPIELLELTEYASSLQDSYIYERLSSCCYGVALILQNNEQFVQSSLPEMAKRLFELQFSEHAKHSVLNYIVVDSIKHLVDLALNKNVTSLSEKELINLSSFQFSLPYQWIEPTEYQRELIIGSDRMSWPEPIGMDFGIYTIPRLIEDDNDTREVISNVYKRIFELGYKASDNLKFTDERFREFYYGNRILSFDGKIDKLGKKYSWKSFFDFAGVLLLKGELRVFEQYSGKKYYERLSDVDIDICMPFMDYKLPIRLYSQNLILNRENDLEWYKKSKIDSIYPLFEQLFDDEEYTMLHGMIEQRIDSEYKTRSFLLAETFFIKKNEYFEKIKQETSDLFFEWNLDIHFSPDRISNAYFGELYWADNMVEMPENNISIPTGKNIVIKRRVGRNDILYSNEYSREDIGKEIEETHPEKFRFDSEPTLVEYLWESDSIILKGYSEYYPSIKMGKTLLLKAEPGEGKILDSNLQECFHSIKFKEDFFENSFSYMRKDLLKKYMSDNNLALLYQVKQHSYDLDLQHNRTMKFFIIE